MAGRKKTTAGRAAARRYKKITGATASESERARLRKAAGSTGGAGASQRGLARRYKTITGAAASQRELARLRRRKGR